MGHSPERRAAVISKLDGAQAPKVQVCVAYTGQVLQIRALFLVSVLPPDRYC
jgi:hypothetical protein